MTQLHLSQPTYWLREPRVSQLLPRGPPKVQTWTQLKKFPARINLRDSCVRQAPPQYSLAPEWPFTLNS